jgi:hypothetical protein
VSIPRWGPLDPDLKMPGNTAPAVSRPLDTASDYAAPCTPDAPAAQRLAASPAPLPLPAIEAGFKGKGPWKKGLPRILDTLEALGRARREGAGWRG